MFIGERPQVKAAILIKKMYFLRWQVTSLKVLLYVVIRREEGGSKRSQYKGDNSPQTDAPESVFPKPIEYQSELRSTRCLDLFRLKGPFC